MNQRNQYQYYSHPNCEYFPCHQGADPSEFNCLFCYCPLYALGDACGGNFSYTKSGIKDCSGCLLPHTRDGYDHIVAGCKKVVELVQKTHGNQGEDPL